MSPEALPFVLAGTGRRRRVLAGTWRQAVHWNQAGERQVVPTCRNL